MKKNISFLFYTFFTCTILSPNIGGFALWMYIFIPLLDFSFLKSLLRYKKKDFNLIFILFFIFFLSFDIVIVFKFMTLIFILCYMKYTYVNNYFYLYKLVSVNIVIGVAQFLFYTIFSFKFMDPTLIAKILYGSYAMTTGITFADGFLFPLRVSGLNREPGFFSSLVMTTLMVCLLDEKVKKRQKKQYLFIFALGIIITFSKVTLVFVSFIPFAYIFRRIINKIDIIIYTFIFVIMMYFGVSYIYDITQVQNYPNLVYQGASFYHRTIGYYVLGDLNLSQLLFGVREPITDLINQIPYIVNSEWWGHDRLIFDNSGVTFIIINMGVISFFAILLIIREFKVKSYSFVVFLLLTISVNPLTTSSFVMISYFILFFGKFLNEKNY